MSYYLRDQNDIPTGMGVMLRVIQMQGKYNMITEFRNACWDAIYLGLYVGQITSADVRVFIENGRELALEYYLAYESREYITRVDQMASAIPFNHEYTVLAKKYGVVQKEFEKTPLELALKKARKLCLKKGVFARDVCGIESAQTDCKETLIQIGAQLW